MLPKGLLQSADLSIYMNERFRRQNSSLGGKNGNVIHLELIYNTVKITKREASGCFLTLNSECVLSMCAGRLPAKGRAVVGWAGERSLIFTMQSIYLPSSGERIRRVGNNIWFGRVPLLPLNTSNCPRHPCFLSKGQLKTHWFSILILFVTALQRGLALSVLKLFVVCWRAWGSPPALAGSLQRLTPQTES